MYNISLIIIITMNPSIQWIYHFKGRKLNMFFNMYVFLNIMFYHMSNCYINDKLIFLKKYMLYGNYYNVE
jgi:hypothetical protein